MSRIILCAIALLSGLAATTQATAYPSCLRDHKAYQLTGDTMQWSMTIAPGANCLQGLRWSYMQIYAVWVLEKPANGELVTVGPAFRYIAKPGFSGTDKFSVVVVGKNRHEEGYSTVEVTVSSANPHPPADAVSQSDTTAGSKVADAAAGR
jgi:hypothetical protein